MFQIFVDSGANIPAIYVSRYDIHVIPFINYVNGVPTPGFEPGLSLEQEREKGKQYYDAIRSGVEVKTSLINSDQFAQCFSEVLRQGEDVIYFCISSNISGTYNAARMAAEELAEEFPDRKICLVDSLNASLATGILAIYAYDLRKNGYDVEKTAELLRGCVKHMNGVFTVDNLKYLAHTGRIDPKTALLGNMLSVKPILRGNADGFIVQFKKYRGRKKALEALINLVCDNIIAPEKQIIGIAHADSYEDSLYVVKKIRERVELRGIINTTYDFCTGSHVGPDTIALFFMGADRELLGRGENPEIPEALSLL